MSPALRDMVRGVAGAPDELRLVRGVRAGPSFFPAGSVIERIGDCHYIGNLRFSMSILIWLARIGVIEEVPRAAA